MGGVKMMKLAFLVLCLVAATFATEGFDLSYFQGDVSESTFSCLKSAGYDFGIIEASKGSEYGLNPYISSVVANARHSFANVDVYIFPDTSYSASSEITSYITDLINDGVLTTNMVWMDIEGSEYWSSSCSDNQNWLKEAIDTVNSLYKGCGLSTCVGIYSSESQWSPIMCNTTMVVLLSLISHLLVDGLNQISNNTKELLILVVLLLILITIKSIHS